MMKFDITKMVEEIAMKAIENQEEFIFETIRPYCENVLQMKINKEELKQILLNSMQKREPCEDCISREAVDNYIVKLMSGYLYDEERARLEDLTAYIWELPSVTPQQKIGHWEMDVLEKQMSGSENPNKWIPVSEKDYIPKNILDKIRAEIEEIPKKYPMTMDYENGLKETLAIIDKYKAESEDEE